MAYMTVPFTKFGIVKPVVNRLSSKIFAIAVLMITIAKLRLLLKLHILATA